MARYDFTLQAAEDLREIGRYTRTVWGGEQARHYRDELKLALGALGLNPTMGRARDEILPKLRSFPVASHIAFYVERKGGITVVRLLHPSMDVESAFHTEEPPEKGTPPQGRSRR
jgi:toxin ParE1/3/4